MINNMNRIIISTALFFISITLVAQNKSQSDDEIYFRSQTKTIASDKFAGRKPLTKYENLTINYIADEFIKNRSYTGTDNKKCRN